MLTTREAARHLVAGSLDSLSALLGFAPALSLGRRDRLRLVSGVSCCRAAIGIGRGTLRALLLECGAGEPPLRETAPVLARHLARAAPRMHWLFLAKHPGTGELLLAAPSAEGGASLPALLVEEGPPRESDAETLATLVAASEGVDLLVHLRWRETLGRDALTARFYRDLESCVGTLAEAAVGPASAEDRRTIALLTTSRLLFLSFLEAKGLLDADRAFLRNGLERLAGGAGLQRRFLEPLFFGTLNTPVRARSPAARALGRVPFLNGGLFTRGGVERRCRDLRLPDGPLAAIIGDLLARYRLTAHEATEALSDAAVDPEMLGRAFECLMGSDTRRRQGAFYTPQALTQRITRQAMEALLERVTDPRELRVLDPACGSGAFLVAALDALVRHSPMLRAGAEHRRRILERCIYGVDRDPTAVWLCQLRLWLSVIVEEEVSDPLALAPLPNLDRNIREGDALAGLAPIDAAVPPDPRIEPIRLRYVRATGARKRTLARLLDRAERHRAMEAIASDRRVLTSERRELVIAARSPDLFRARRGLDADSVRRLGVVRSALRDCSRAERRLRDGGALPFAFATHFPDVTSRGGFDLVIGNPPWVRPHALAPDERVALRARFECARRAAWEEGAAASAAGRGFASQADLAALFTERAVDLTRNGGIIALLLPSKLWRALAGGGIRRLLRERTDLLALDEWGGRDSGALFDAAVYPTALIARRLASGPTSARSSVAFTRLVGNEARTATIPFERLPLDQTEGAPWLLLPDDARRAFDRLVSAGTPLAGTRFGRPLLGVKTGCNEAFVVEPGAPLREEELRPLIRGEDLRAWGLAPEATPRAILWTHDARGEAVAELSASSRRWLSRWRHALESRSDARSGRWWSLLRIESARCDRPRVVWADIGRAPRALVLRRGDPTVPLNTCYVVRAPSEDDAHALAALFNSRIATAWLAAIAEPARGGYRRYLGWTCARLPVPRDWVRALAPLAAIGRAAALGDPPDAVDLDREVSAAFGVSLDEVAPLLAWHDG